MRSAAAAGLEGASSGMKGKFGVSPTCRACEASSDVSLQQPHKVFTEGHQGPPSGHGAPLSPKGPPGGGAKVTSGGGLRPRRRPVHFLRGSVFSFSCATARSAAASSKFHSVMAITTLSRGSRKWLFTCVEKAPPSLLLSCTRRPDGQRPSPWLQVLLRRPDSETLAVPTPAQAARSLSAYSVTSAYLVKFSLSRQNKRRGCQTPGRRIWRGRLRSAEEIFVG